MLTINKTQLSLQVGAWEKLEANKPVAWSSNNPNVVVDENGFVTAIRDAFRPDGLATITATNGTETKSCSVTIVNWPTNHRRMNVTKTFNATSVQGLLPSKLNNGIVVADDKTLYKVVNGDFTNLEQLATFPEILANTPILDTPYGYFARGDKGYTGSDTTTNIYHSTDLKNWSVVHTVGMTGLYHGFDFYFRNGTLYVYACEYGTNTNHRFKVFRGTYTSSSNGKWETIMECFSQNEYRASKENKPSVRHFHVATVDQRTGDLFVGAGDDNHECHLWLSTDNGNTFKLLGSGSQQYRILSVWFTDKYIYWNMDSAANQTVFRLARSNLGQQTPQNDLKEKVAELYNGSHWYHCWAKDEKNEDIVVMGIAPEGQQRDWLSRLISFKELPNGKVEVNELTALPSSTPGVYDNGITMYAQIEPKFFHNGKLYVRGRYTNPPAGGSKSNWLSGLMEMELVKNPRKPVRRKWRTAFR